jgi:hypothetical protein
MRPGHGDQLRLVLAEVGLPESRPSRTVLVIRAVVRRIIERIATGSVDTTGSVDPFRAQT